RGDVPGGRSRACETRGGVVEQSRPDLARAYKVHRVRGPDPTERFRPTTFYPSCPACTSVRQLSRPYRRGTTDRTLLFGRQDALGLMYSESNRSRNQSPAVGVATDVF